MAKRQSQTHHDWMVQYTANFLVNKSYRNIKADLPGFDTPVKITWKSTGNGHIPDVTADGQQFNLFEVETADSIDDQHTADQWTLFARYAKEHQAVFWVVIPSGYASSANRRLSELGIKASVWEV